MLEVQTQKSPKIHQNPLLFNSKVIIKPLLDCFGVQGMLEWPSTTGRGSVVPAQSAWLRHGLQRGAED
jgi:hypothetical protein